jgi:cobalt-zinc-cadmium efflux system membrane fusion protein
MIVRLLLLAVLALVSACDSSSPPAGESAEHDDQHDAPTTQTRIAAAVAAEAGLTVAPAAPGRILDTHEVRGLLTPVEGRHARVVARFPGPVRRVHVAVGDTVKAGQTLITIESNISLTTYPVTAPFAGTVLRLDVAAGELAGDAPLLELADLSTLWVDLHLFGSDAQHLHAGLPVRVIRLADGVSVDLTIDRILPAMASASQSTVARAVLPNGDGQWRPGAAVRARVTVAERDAAIVVPAKALQQMAGQDVVFVREGEVYRQQPVTLGERDDERVEVLTGLTAGQDVVVDQSYLIKADLEKSTVDDDH